MYKNLIKKHLSSNLSEATAPAIQLANKIAKDNKKINTKELKDIAKDLSGYEESSMTAKDEKEIAHNKFNYTDDNAKTYHDEMEIMNGQEMITFAKEPTDRFTERALEGIEGSSKMGNNPEWANVVAKGQGGDPEFGKNLVKKIKSSIQKRKDAEKNWFALGDDIEFDPKINKKFEGKPHAFESTEKKKTIKEGISEKGIQSILKMIEKRGLRGSAIKLVDLFLQRETNGMVTSSDLGDTAIFANGVDEVEELLSRQSFDEALNVAEETANEMLSDEGFDGMDEGSMGDEYLGEEEDYEKASREVQYGINPYNDPEENINDSLYDKILSVESHSYEGCREYGVLVEFEKNGEEGEMALCVRVTKQEWKPEDKSVGFYGGITKLEFEIFDGVIYEYNIIKKNQINLTSDQLEILNNDEILLERIDSIISDILYDDYDNRSDLYETKKDVKETEIEKGKFTKWCKSKGFDKPSISCAKEAMKDKYDASTHKMATFYMNTVKPQGKTTKDLEEEKNKNKKQIKESMKRLKFKTEFNGFGNAIKLIPESYKVDQKTFEMTDGNETYRIRWEGSINEGKAVILVASDKKLVNEDIQRMKNLFSYKSEETLGTLKGNARIDENKTFGDIWKKTKSLLEMEDIEGTDGEEGDWDDAITSQASDAKKHVEGSVSKEKGTHAKATTGNWDDVKKSAPEATKHVQGSASTDKGTKAPKSKTGHWDDAVTSQAAEAKKHVTSESLKKKITENETMTDEGFMDVAAPASAFALVVAPFIYNYVTGKAAKMAAAKAAKGGELTKDEIDAIKAELSAEMAGGIEKSINRSPSDLGDL